jgi:hypothetical protein
MEVPSDQYATRAFSLFWHPHDRKGLSDVVCEVTMDSSAGVAIVSPPARELIPLTRRWSDDAA